MQVSERKEAPAASRLERGLRRVPLLAFTLFAVLACLQAWAARQFLNPDGVSYLDIGDAYFRGDWESALNAYWSPLYSWILGAALYATRPAMEWEIPVVHAVNFALYLLAFGCFHYFLVNAIDGAAVQRREDGGGEFAFLPRHAWLALGYTLFGWTSLNLIGLDIVTPDLLSSALVYLAAGLVLRIRQAGWETLRRRRIACGILLGVVLGFGYMAKAALFPLAFAFLAAAVAGRSWRRNLAPGVAALLTFLGVSAPFAAAVSRQAGRLSIGEAGRLNHRWALDDQWFPRSGLARVNYSGAAAPVRLLHGNPDVLLYSGLDGTVPFWKNPAAWKLEASGAFNVARQGRLVARNARALAHMALDRFAAGFLILVLWILSDRRALLDGIRGSFALLAGPLAGLVLYLLVHVESRYCAAFLVLLAIALLIPVRIRTAMAPAPAVLALVIAACFHMVAVTGESVVHQVFVAPAASSDLEAAAELRRLGVRPGDEVAFAGDPLPGSWARLARLEIRAEIPDERAFWSASRTARESVTSELKGAGIAALIASGVPRNAAAEGWARLSATHYHVRLLR